MKKKFLIFLFLLIYSRFKSTEDYCEEKYFNGDFCLKTDILKDPQIEWKLFSTANKIRERFIEFEGTKSCAKSDKIFEFRYDFESIKNSRAAAKFNYLMSVGKCEDKFSEMINTIYSRIQIALTSESDYFNNLRLIYFLLPADKNKKIYTYHVYLVFHCLLKSKYKFAFPSQRCLFGYILEFYTIFLNNWNLLSPRSPSLIPFEYRKLLRKKSCVKKRISSHLDNQEHSTEFCEENVAMNSKKLKYSEKNINLLPEKSINQSREENIADLKIEKSHLKTLNDPKPIIIIGEIESKETIEEYKSEEEHEIKKSEKEKEEEYESIEEKTRKEKTREEKIRDEEGKDEKTRDEEGSEGVRNDTKNNVETIFDNILSFFYQNALIPRYKSSLYYFFKESTFKLDNAPQDFLNQVISESYITGLIFQQHTPNNSFLTPESLSYSNFSTQFIDPMPSTHQPSVQTFLEPFNRFPLSYHLNINMQTLQLPNPTQLIEQQTNILPFMMAPPNSIPPSYNYGHAESAPTIFQAQTSNFVLNNSFYLPQNTSRNPHENRDILTGFLRGNPQTEYLMSPSAFQPVEGTHESTSKCAERFDTRNENDS